MKKVGYIVALAALLLAISACRETCDRCQVTFANATAYEVIIRVNGTKVKTLLQGEPYVMYIGSGKFTQVEADIQSPFAHSDLDLNLFCAEDGECRDFFYTIK